MHEMSYCEGVVAAVERRAAGRRVAAVGVRIGIVHRVVSEAFQQSFEMAAAGGVAADAVTELVVVPIAVGCRDCGATGESDDPGCACAGCGSFAVDREGGDEVTLEWIRYAAAAVVDLDQPDIDRRGEVVPEHRHDLADAPTGPR